MSPAGPVFNIRRIIALCEKAHDIVAPLLGLPPSPLP
jgi:hypothetical protein